MLTRAKTLNKCPIQYKFSVVIVLMLNYCQLVVCLPIFMKFEVTILETMVY